MNTIIEPPRMPLPDHALTPVDQPALTPIRPPSRRMVVKTAVSPEAQAEIAAAERRFAQEARMKAEIEGAQTLIGYPAPIVPPPALNSGRDITNVPTVLKRPPEVEAALKKIQEMPTDPMRPVPPIPGDVTIRPGFDVLPVTLPPGNGVKPGLPIDLGGVTVPPGHNVALGSAPAKDPVLGATVPPGHNVALDDIGFASTLPPSQRPAPVVYPEPKRELELVKPAKVGMVKVPEPIKLENVVSEGKLAARAGSDITPLHQPRVKKRSPALIVAVGLAAIATGVALGVVLKKVVTPAAPTQTAIEEIKTAP